MHQVTDEDVASVWPGRSTWPTTPEGHGFSRAVTHLRNPGALAPEVRLVIDGNPGPPQQTRHVLHHRTHPQPPTPFSNHRKRRTLPRHTPTLPSRRPLQTARVRRNARPHPSAPHPGEHPARTRVAVHQGRLLTPPRIEASRLAAWLRRPPHPRPQRLHHASRIHPPQSRTRAPLRAPRRLPVLLGPSLNRPQRLKPLPPKHQVGTVETLPSKIERPTNPKDPYRSLRLKRANVARTNQTRNGPTSAVHVLATNRKGTASAVR